jgi:uncharacterized protein (DUF983 family)
MTSRPNGWRLLGRCLRLRCPVCGQGPIFRSWFAAHERCERCGFVFARDNEYGQEGYFTGAMAINVVITGVLPLIAIFVLALTSRFPVVPLTTAGVIWTALFPILFYRHACAIWIVIDHLINPPSPAELAGERRATPVASPLAADRERLKG